MAGVAEQDVGDRLAGVGRVGGGVMAAGRVGCRAARDDRGDGAGHGAQPSVRRAGPSPGWAQDPPPSAPMRPLMRRLSLLPLLLAGLVLAPAAAQAATPGVNIVGSADVARSGSPPAPRPSACSPCAAASRRPIPTSRTSSLPPGPAAWASSSCSSATATAPTTDPTDFANFAAAFATQMKSVGGATAYEVWNEEDETDFWGAAVDAAHYAEILKAAYPRIKAADPSAKVLLGPLTGNNYNFLGPDLRRRRRQLVRRRRGPHRHGLPRRSAELLLPRRMATSRASPSSASAPSTTSWSPTATAPSRSG